MHKRINIVVRNIGLEGSQQAMQGLQLDFDDEAALERANEALRIGLKNPLDQSVIITNGNGQWLGFNPHHYSYHYVGDLEEWESREWQFDLPVDGERAPGRES